MHKKSRLFFLFAGLTAFVFQPLSFAEEKIDSPPPSQLQKSTTSQNPVQKPLPNPVQTIFTPKADQVEAVGDSIEYRREDKKIIARNNVVITYKDLKITADYAEVETETKQAYAKGHVILFKQDEPRAYGEEVHYDFGTQKGSFPNGSFLGAPWYGRGEEVNQVKQGEFDIENGSFTSCNLEQPHYALVSKHVKVYTGDKMIAKNVRVKALGRTIFWLPYVVVPLKQNQFPISVTAGYKSDYGAYVEASKGFSINQNIGGQLHADYRAKRGFGGGADFDYDYGKSAHGDLKAYWTQDKRAPTPGRENPFSEREERDRGRLTLRHRTDINENTNIILRYNRLADEYFLQDFFEKEFRSDIEQNSFATLTHNTDKYGAMLHASPRVNKFESMVQRRPQARLDWKNQNFFIPEVYYTSQVLFDNLTKVRTRSNNNTTAVRGDTFHEWIVPLNWNQIKFTPYVQLRETLYSREKESSNARLRNLITVGTDLRTQAYKTYDVNFDVLGIEVNQIRHILEPNVQIYTRSSNVSSDELERFDYVDRLDDAHVVTLGVENRLQTKRTVAGKVQRVDIVSLNTFLSYELSPDGRFLGQSFSDIENTGLDSGPTVWSQEFIVRPYEWMQYAMRYDYDLQRDSFRVFNQDILIRKTKFRMIFGHRFAKDLFGPDSSQFVFDGKYQMNKLWAVGGYIRWDPRSHFGLQEWQLSAERDLHDFIFEFGYNVRNSDINTSNKSLYANFRLKALPSLVIRGGGNHASFSEPRIGETVSGANQDFGFNSTLAGQDFFAS